MRNDFLFSLMRDSELYHVDRAGQVWTRKKMGGQTTYEDRWRRAETAPAPRYRQVRHNGKMVYAHRFVYWWFHCDITNGLEVDHVDGDNLNNHPDNLQLLTRQENQIKAERQCNIKRVPTEARKKAMRDWWSRPGVREKMSRAAKVGWETRRINSD